MTKQDKDLDALARRIKNLPNAPLLGNPQPNLFLQQPSSLWLIDSVGVYVALGGASVLWLALYLVDRRRNAHDKRKR
jgi:threonine/homoserine efflux transporter RhtA